MPITALQMLGSSPVRPLTACLSPCRTCSTGLTAATKHSPAGAERLTSSSAVYAFCRTSPTGLSAATRIGRYVSIGKGCMIRSATVEDEVRTSLRQATAQAG